MVECSYQCGAHLPRRLMDEHQRDECPQRSIDARLKQLEERHRREMKDLETRLTTEREKEMTERERHEKEIREMEERHEREMRKMEARLSTEREHHDKKIREIEDKHRSEIFVAMKSEMTESDKRHELELAKQRKETEIKMAELKVTIISSTHYVVTTPPQDEYTSKLAETLERVRKIEEETIPQMTKGK